MTDLCSPAMVASAREQDPVSRTLRVAFLGRLVDAAGARVVDFDVPFIIRNVGALRTWLADAQPSLAAALTSRDVKALLNDRVVRDDEILLEASEIAFFPPVSGG